MSLRRKTLLIISVTLVVLIIVIYLVSQVIVLDSYRDIEQDTLRKDLERGRNALLNDISVMANSTLDYAAWDEVAAYVNGTNPEFPAVNMENFIFTDFGVNIMLILDNEPSVLFSKGVSDEGETVPVSDELINLIISSDLLSQHPDIESRVSGLLRVPQGLMIVASMPIQDSDREGDVYGSFIWLREFDMGDTERLSQATQLEIDARLFNDPALPADYLDAKAEMTAEHVDYIRPINSQTISIYNTLSDVYGDPAMLMRVTVPRQVYQQGRETLNFLVIALAVVSFAFGITVLVLLERLILSRLARFTRTVREIGQLGDLSRRVATTGNDEVTQLGDSINTMLTALQSSQDELRTAKESAEAANNAKSTFLANMSHELRTPLNAILGFVGIMLMNKTLSEQDEFRANRIRNNGERLLEIIDDVLDLSRIEAGRLSLVAADVRIRAMLENIESQIRMLANEKSVNFTVDIQSSVPDVLQYDQDAMIKIITNLLSNAVKFTDKGGSVHLDVRRQDENLILEVKDTGIGIPSHMHEVIFESFRQVDGSSTRAYGGTGLGLAIVQRLCKAMNGTVSLVSDVGEGSTFTVRLPIIQNDAKVKHNGD